MLVQKIALLSIISGIAFGQQTQKIDLLQQTRSTCKLNQLWFARTNDGATYCPTDRIVWNPASTSLYFNSAAEANTNNSMALTFRALNDSGVAQNGRFQLNLGGSFLLQGPDGLQLMDNSPSGIVAIGSKLGGSSPYALYTFDGKTSAGINLASVGTTAGQRSQPIIGRYRPFAGSYDYYKLDAGPDGLVVMEAEGISFMKNHASSGLYFSALPIGLTYQKSDGSATPLFEANDQGKVFVNNPTFKSRNWRMSIKDTAPALPQGPLPNGYHAGLEYVMNAPDWSDGYLFSPTIIEGIRSQMVIPSNSNPGRLPGTSFYEPNFYTGIGTHVISHTSRMTAVGGIFQAWTQSTRKEGMTSFTHSITVDGTSGFSGNIIIAADAPPAALYQWEVGQGSVYVFYIKMDNEWMAATLSGAYPGSTYPINLPITVTTANRGALQSVQSAHVGGTGYITTGAYAFGANSLSTLGTAVCDQNQIDSGVCTNAERNTEINAPGRVIGYEININGRSPFIQSTGMLFNGVSLTRPREYSWGIEMARLGWYITQPYTISSANLLTGAASTYPHKLQIGDRVFLNACTNGANNSVDSSNGMGYATVTGIVSSQSFTIDKTLAVSGACQVTRIDSETNSLDIPWDVGFGFQDGAAVEGMFLGLQGVYNGPSGQGIKRSMGIKMKSFGGAGFKYSYFFTDPNGYPMVVPGNETTQAANTQNLMVVRNRGNSQQVAGIGANLDFEGNGWAVKSAILFERGGPYGMANFHFASNSASDGSAVSVANKRFTVLNNGRIFAWNLQECASAISKEICYDNSTLAAGAATVKFKP